MTKKIFILIALVLSFYLPSQAQISSRVNATTIKNAMSCADTSITANTITCSTFQGLTAYVTGQTFFVQVANTTTGAATININGLGAKSVTKNGTSPIASGDLVANGAYVMRYDGTEFVVLGNMSAGSLPSGPTSPNGVPQFLTSTPSGGVAGSPVYALAGVQPRHVSGTTSTDTVASTDSNNTIVYDGSVAVAVTLPTPTTLGISQFASHLVNNTTGTATIVTITATTNTFATTGNNTLQILQGQSCTITVQSSSVWDDECHDLPFTAGANITITRGTNGPSIASTASGGADICDTVTTTDTITNTVNTVQNFATTCVIPSSTFTANKIVNLSMSYGEVAGTTSQTLNIGGTIGGSSFYATNTAIPTITTGTTADWLLHCQFGGTAAPGASVAVTIGCSVVGSGNVMVRNTIQQVSLATNGTLTVAFTAQWGGTTGTNTASLLALRVY